MKVRELMTTDLITVSPQADLAWADDVMGIAEVRHLPVVDEERLVGLVTRRDLLRASLSVLADLEVDQVNAMMHAVKISAIMRRGVQTIDPDADVRDAIATMIDQKYGCVPVVEGNRLVGIITESDFLCLARELVSERDKPWLKRSLPTADDEEPMVDVLGDRR